MKGNGHATTKHEQKTEWKNEPKAKPKSSSKDPNITLADTPLIQLYDSLKEKNGFLDVAKFVQKLWEHGIHINDYPSLKDARVTVFSTDKCTDPLKLDLPMFLKAARPIKSVILKAFANELVIPDFPHFTRTLQLMCEAVKLNKRGTVLYSPENPTKAQDIWAVSICSIDGQKWGYGQIDHPFTLQGCCTPLLYGLALQSTTDRSADVFVNHEHSVIGMTPFSTDPFGRPLNPLSEAGAIHLCATMETYAIYRMGPAERFQYALNFIKEMTGGGNVVFNNSAYLTKVESVSINQSLKYYLQTVGVSPIADFDQALNLYQQACCIQLDCKSLSVIAGTLANGGVNPLTKKRLLETCNVQDVLSSMSTSGIYNESALYLVEVGIPSKASKTGVIMGVIPGLFGIALYSPRVDQNNISVRGYQFMHTLSEAYYFHKFEPPSLKRVVTPVIEDKKCTFNCFLFKAVAEGDILLLIRLVQSGSSMFSVDLMDRTLLHAAVQHKQIDIICFLAALYPELLNKRDNMGNTPYDDAHHFKDPEVVKFILVWEAIMFGNKEKSQESNVSE